MVRNQVRVQVRHKVMTGETSQVDHTQTYSITLEISQKGQFQQRTYD